MGGPNRYGYAINDPINRTDYSGLQDVEVRDDHADVPGNAERLDIRHWWMRTKNKEAGLGPRAGGVPGEGPYNLLRNMPLIPTSINDHSGRGNRKGARCRRVPQIQNTCADNELQIGKQEGPFGVIICKDIVEHIAARCSVPSLRAPSDMTQVGPAKRE
jgi:hypothetical protein